MSNSKAWRTGLELGIPIGLGYFSVSIAYGMSAVLMHLTPVMAALISITNLTSAGQFAGTRLMAEHAGWTELILTMLVINARYFLMAISLSQKLDPAVTLSQRLLIAYGITDEIYAAAISRKGTLTFSFYMGLLTLPVIGWTAGTYCGAVAGSLLPADLASAFGIAMYGMFLAILVPKARTSKPVLACILLSAVTSILCRAAGLSAGWTVILCTIAVSALMAWKHPEASDELE